MVITKDILHIQPTQQTITSQNQGFELKTSPASVILLGEVTLLLSTPPNKANSALLAIDGLPPRPPSIVGLRLGVRDCWLELRWWPPAPPPELRLPSRLRVRWPTSLGLLLDPPMAKACSAFKDREKTSVRQQIKKET